MKELRRHKLTFAILAPIVSVFVKLRFRYKYDDLGGIEGPYLLLVNHNMELDPVLVGVAAKRHLYFVASEHIMRKGLGTWFLMRYFQPIIHKKGKQGIQTVKQMLKMLRDGQSVCIFPEGNRSFNGLTGDILPTIGKVAGRSGVKLVTYRIEGGYLTQPRWSLTLRRGRIRGRLIREYSAMELKNMTDAQINKAICEDLYEDAYATQQKERIPFRGKNLALGMESTVFACPACGGIGTLHSDPSRIYCDCGWEAVYDVYGELTDKLGKVYTVTQLDMLQRRRLTENVASCKENELLFSDSVTWYVIDDHHNVIKTESGKLAAYSDRLECLGRVIPYGEIQGMAIFSRNFMILHIQGVEGHIEIKADKMFCALKYLYLYHEINGQNAKEEVQ